MPMLLVPTVHPAIGFPKRISAFANACFHFGPHRFCPFVNLPGISVDTAL